MQPKRLLPPYEVFLETRWFLPGSASEPFTLAGRRVGALGYGTLWGDLAGLLSPIGDLPKTEVVRLSRWVARTRGTIPQFVLERPPSAELSAGTSTRSTTTPWRRASRRSSRTRGGTGGRVRCGRRSAGRKGSASSTESS